MPFRDVVDKPETFYATELSQTGAVVVINFFLLPNPHRGTAIIFYDSPEHRQ